MSDRYRKFLTGQGMGRVRRRQVSRPLLPRPPLPRPPPTPPIPLAMFDPTVGQIQYTSPAPLTPNLPPAAQQPSSSTKEEKYPVEPPSPPHSETDLLMADSDSTSRGPPEPVLGPSKSDPAPPPVLLLPSPFDLQGEKETLPPPSPPRSKHRRSTGSHLRSDRVRSTSCSD